MIDIRKLRYTDLAALKPGEVLLPTSKYGAEFIIGGLGGERVAVCLSGDNRFRAFMVRGDTSAWQGIALGYTSVEVDYKRAVCIRTRYAQPGDIVLKNGCTYLCTIFDQSFGRGTLIHLQGEETSSGEEGVYFPEWDIVSRDDSGERRVLVSARAAAT